MGKKSAPRRLADNEANAELRMVRISPQKLNLVAGLIRGLKVEKALLIGHSLSDRETTAVLFKRKAGKINRILTD